MESDPRIASNAFDVRAKQGNRRRSRSMELLAICNGTSLRTD